MLDKEQNVLDTLFIQKTQGQYDIRTTLNSAELYAQVIETEIEEKGWSLNQIEKKLAK